MTASPDWSIDQNICFVGFGEAGVALSGGFKSQSPVAWDQKLSSKVFGFRERIQSAGYQPASSLEDGLVGIDWVVSLVTADQAAIDASKCSSVRSKLPTLK